MRVKPAKPGPVWKFFSSIWLAVFLILFVAVVCAIGHGFGIKETEQVFFESWWFSALLLVLALNITVCTLNRSHPDKPGWFPYQLSQLPWLMVHLGLLIIIAGGVLTRFRTEGQLLFQEGTASRRMYLQDRELVVERPAAEAVAYDLRLSHLPMTETLLERGDHVFVIGVAVWATFLLLAAGAARLVSGKDAALAVGVLGGSLGLVVFLGTGRAADWTWDLGNGAALQFEKYYPHHTTKLVRGPDPSGQGPPALELHMETTRRKQEFTRWLCLEPGQQNELELPGLGVATQRFYTREDLERALNGKETLGALVLIDKDGNEVAVSLDPIVPAPASTEPNAGTPLDRTVQAGGHTLHLSRFFWKLVVIQNAAQDDAPGQLVNPAVQIDQVTFPDGRVEKFDRFFAFGRPDLRHVKIHATPELDVSYRFPSWGLHEGHRTVSFVVGPTSKDVRLLEVDPHANRPPPTTADEVLGLPRVGPDGVQLAVGDETLKVRVLRHARSITDEQQLVYADPSKEADAEKLPDAVFVRLKVGEHEATGWLPFGFTVPNRVPFRVGDDTWLLSYQAKTYDLPFELFLKDFKIEWAPGQENMRPLAFESEVKVNETDPAAGMPSFDYRIYMNHTLVHQGFTFYQSSYIRQPGQPDVSVLSVQSDPGQYVFYAGALIMSLGVLAIFYLKPWLRQVELRRRGQAPLPRKDEPVPAAAAPPDPPAQDGIGSSADPADPAPGAPPSPPVGS